MCACRQVYTGRPETTDDFIAAGCTRSELISIQFGLPGLSGRSRNPVELDRPPTAGSVRPDFNLPGRCIWTITIDTVLSRKVCSRICPDARRYNKQPHQEYPCQSDNEATPASRSTTLHIFAPVIDGQICIGAVKLPANRYQQNREGNPRISRQYVVYQSFWVYGAYNVLLKSTGSILDTGIQ